MSRRNDDDLAFDRLRAARPHSDGPAPAPRMNADARFEEITMQPHDVLIRPDHPTDDRRPEPSTPWWRRSLIATPTLASLAVFGAVAVVAFTNLSSTSAQEKVVAAASQVTSFDSGRATIEAEFLDHPEFTGTMIIDSRYDGERFMETIDGSGIQVTDPGLAAELGDMEDLEPSVLIEVDGRRYLTVTDESRGSGFIEIVEDSMPDPGSFIRQSNVDGAAVATLIELTDEFREIDSSDGTVTYAGTLPPSALTGISAEELPAGLSLMADDGESTVERVDVTVVVRDDTIERTVVAVAGQAPDERRFEAVLTTTISELGQPQNITAPTPDQMLRSSDHDE